MAKTATRLAMALGLACLAASIPPLRAAVLDWIGAANALPEWTSADGPKEPPAIRLS